MKFDFNTLEFTAEHINPNKIAIVSNDIELTWAEFKNDVEIKKEKLKSFDLPTGHPVVIYGHKESNFVSYMIACVSLKLPYIPVDTIYPQERLNTIVNALESSIVIHTSDDRIEYNKTKHDTSYDRDDNIIYMLFTSGSTGTPKGVQITKTAVLSFVEWLKSDLDFTDKNILIGQALFTFDISILDVWSTMLLGGTIILIDRKVSNDNELFNAIVKKYKCNIFMTTPSFVFKCLISDNFNQDNLPDLQNFLLIGETLTHRIATKAINRFKNACITNNYGPTEATVSVTTNIITEEIIKKYPKFLPIGYPKTNGNSKIEIRNKNEAGVGELVLFGDNVSIGYLDDALNKGKFFTENGVRAFNSGDLAYTEDGKIFLVGRADDQIKLNGYRIEIDEIDSEIHKLDGVKDSATIPLKQGEKVLRLVSFIILNDKAIDKDHIITHLSTTLPEYMIPSDIMFLNQFPYTPSHKLDKSNLIELYRNS